ncbi:MAG: hypothetical protein JRN21_00835 [Nitrososphaerota archaeon]|nr:hypothetical protein [Nitrososphaerota archaeon]
MKKKQIGLLVTEIGLPIGMGTLIWAVFNEPVIAVTFGFLLSILSLQVNSVFNEERSNITFATPSLRNVNDHVTRLLKDSSGNKLFSEVMGAKLSKLDSEIGSSSIEFAQADIEPKAKLMIERCEKGGRATSLVNLGEYWTTVGDYFELCRKATKEGKKITRMFILQKSVLAEQTQKKTREALLKQISEDSQAGIEVYVIDSDMVGDAEAIQDFGIWDEKVLCHVQPTGRRSKEVKATYSAIQEDLDKANRWWEVLVRARVAPMQALDSFVDSNLKGSGSFLSKDAAIELRDTAKKTEELSKGCRSTFLSGGKSESCSWYHGAWQYLRLLDMVSTPDWHAEFYHNALTTVMQTKPGASILISGLADYAMLGHVRQAVRYVNANPSIVVTDICSTPLRMSEWYANKYGFTIQTVEGHIVNTPALKNSSFDVIVTDAFVTRFRQDETEDVIKRWKNLLVHHGKVITTIRISDESRSFTATQEQQSEFVDRAWSRAVDRGGLVLEAIGYERLKEIARSYAARIGSYPFKSDEARSLFLKEGFTLKFDERTTPGEFEPTKYLEIIAEKS